MKRDFEKELKDLTALKSDFETKFAEIDVVRKRYEARFRKLAKTNEVQDKRLEVLEIQEKAKEFFRNGDYYQAIEYINVALLISPEDLTSLRIKAHCLATLGNVIEHLNIREKIMKLSEHNISDIANVLELYLLLERQSDYKNLIQQYSTEVNEIHSGYVGWYFQGLQSYFKDDIDSLKNIIEQKKDLLSNETEKEKKMNWIFNEARQVLKSRSESSIKAMLLKQIEYLEGKISGKELLNYIETNQ